VHVYVTNLFHDTLVAFRRDAATGKLSFIEQHADDTAGVDGLGGPFDVAVSPDGAHVYVAAVESAVAVFARDPTSGRLTFVEVERQGVNGVDGIAGAFALTVSPDGAHVYVGNRSGNSVAVFSRNPGTGGLTFVEVQRDGVGGVDGLAGVQSLAVSPDGAHVYVAGEDDNALAVFSRNPVTGALTFVEVQRDGVNGVDGLYVPQAVTVSADGAHVYAGSYYDRGVSVFSRDPGTGQLTFVQVVREDGGTAPYIGPVSYVTVSPDGANVYSVAYNGVAVVFARDPSTGMLTFVENQFMGDPQWVGCSPDAAHVYIATEPPGPGYVYAFARAPGTGALSLIERERGFELVPLTMALTADGSHLYVVIDLYFVGHSALAVLSRDTATGALAPVEVYRSVEADFTMLAGANSVAVSTDGASVYVASGPGGGALAVFARDPATGRLTFVELEQDGVGGVDGLSFVNSVAVSPDDAHVYATGPGDNAVAVFSRAGTGALTFVEVQRDGVGGADGLAGAHFVAVSPDGVHVYVGSAESDATAFSRDAATGRLTYVDKGDLRTGGFGVLAVSPDGAHVYTRGSGLAAYSRDATTGRLTFVELEEYGVGGVDGFQGSSLFVSADGEMVYAPNSAFARDAATGRLTFVEIPDGLVTYGPGVVSPDGRHLYLVPFSSVVTFTPYSGCPATPLTGCDTAGGGVLRLTHGVHRDKLVWKWRLGTVLPADFGDPTTDTHFAFCVYDESGAPSLVMRALVPAAGDCRVEPLSSDCWDRVLQYYDRYATPEGILFIRYLAGDPGKARFVVSGQGEHLTLPALPLDLPLRAQLQNSQGACWESTYSAAIVNHAGAFRAAAD